MERRAGIGRGRLGAARAPPQPETREMQAQSIEQITQGLQNATVGGRYRPSARPPRPNERPSHREERSTDSGNYSGPPSDPSSPEHQSLAQRVRAEVKTKEQKLMEDDMFDQGAHLQPAMKQKIEEGKFYGTSGTEVMLSSNFYRVDMRNMMRDERGRDVSWYQYRVDFKPAVDDVQKREELIDYIAENNTDIFPPLYIFEGTMIFAFSQGLKFSVFCWSPLLLSCAARDCDAVSHRKVRLPARSHVGDRGRSHAGLMSEKIFEN